MTDISLGEYNVTVGLFTDKVNECKGLKDRIQSACNDLNAWPVPWIDSDTIWKMRDKMFEWIDKLFNGIEQMGRDVKTGLTYAVEGAAAPVTFIKHAGNWKTQVAGAVTPAVAAVQTDVAVSSYWQGTAADEYAEATKKQVLAVQAAHTVSGKIGDELLTLANSGWEMYKALFEGLKTFLEKMADILGKFGNPVNWFAELEAAVNCVSGAASFVADITAAAATAIRDQFISRVNFEAIQMATPGFSGDSWPSSLSGTFNNATVLDGYNDWSIKPGVIKN